MFAQKTVFIVGAGGSYEIGLPIGETLKAIISNKLDISRDGKWGDRGETQVFRAVLNLSRKSKDEWEEMRRLVKASEDVKAAMPLAISIDNYLNTHFDNTDIVTMGKVGIAASILDAERSSSISGIDGGHHILDFSKAPDSWHNTFCKMLTENVRLKDLDRIFDNVSFITFNYDRCIEHYLVMWLMTYMRLTYQDACNICKNLTVFHPYGQVGALPWQSSDGIGVQFGIGADEYNLVQTSKSIKTFTERVDDESMLSQIRNAISEGQNIIYLGFAYGQMNMDLMKLENLGPSKRIYGTVLNMSESNITEVSRRIDSALTHGGNSLILSQNLVSATANDLLKNYWYTLSS
ncbi:hypothetical protein [Agrobacterium cavarae]|uniref:hypothetical protein n=1 Tax=Agrobacterium cavarae TaxID=2528239 RepID=UPI003FD340DC